MLLHITQPHSHLLCYIDKPDFARWLEYTLTSPLQIIVIGSTVYMRNAEQLLLISTLQGALTLCGWTLETLVYHLQITAMEAGKGSLDFLRVLSRLTAVFAGAVYVHCVIWVTIFAALRAHEENLVSCDYGIAKLPAIIKRIVVVQCVCFSLFAVPLVVQVAAVLLTARVSLHAPWEYASFSYGILSLASKGLLAVMFVKLLTDNNCIDTRDGQTACLL
jgi:hypothetical protein